MILCILCDVFKVYMSNMIQKQQKYNKEGDFEFWTWAPHLIMIWNITVKYKFWRLIFSRMPKMQILYPYYVLKKTHESNVALTDVWLYLKIWAQWIDYKTID